MDFNIICTYQLIDDDEEESKLLYQIQFLQIFNFTELNLPELKIKQDNIYEQIKNDKKFINIMKIIKNKYSYLSFSDLDLFPILFSYDYLHEFVKCLRDFDKNQEITSLNYKNLINLF